MDAAERLARGLVDAERKRRIKVPGAEVIEVDGLVLALANMSDPALNSIVVEHEPRDPAGALLQAEEEFVRRGQRLGIDLQLGRHLLLDAAIREVGLVRIIERPGMAAALDDMASAPVPAGMEIRVVSGEAEADALIRVGVGAFGDDPDVAGAFYGAGAYGVPGSWSFVAWNGDEPVATAAAYLHEGAVGIMGVGVVSAARRRGIGAAITAHAARSFSGADLVWLHPSEMALGMYEGLGFRRVSDWEVWVRRPGA